MARPKTRRLISCVESVAVRGDELRVDCRFGVEHVTRGQSTYTWENRTILLPEFQLRALLKKALEAMGQEVSYAQMRRDRLRGVCT
mgnify:CR=1 FL=1